MGGLKKIQHAVPPSHGRLENRRARLQLLVHRFEFK